MTQLLETQSTINEDEELLYLTLTPMMGINGKKILQIRGQLHDKEKVNTILSKAFTGNGIKAMIVFRDPFKAYLRCVDLGFIDAGKITLKK